MNSAILKTCYFKIKYYFPKITYFMERDKMVYKFRRGLPNFENKRSLRVQKVWEILRDFVCLFSNFYKVTQSAFESFVCVVFWFCRARVCALGWTKIVGDQ